MKRILAFVLASLMLFALVSTAAAEEPVTLRILWWGSQTRHDLTMAAIEKFMEKNPDIKIEPEYTSWDGYWEKVATQIAGGGTGLTGSARPSEPYVSFCGSSFSSWNGMIFT